MMEYKDGEVIVATPCEHVFHKRCLREWFQLSRTCPVCRTDVPEALGMTETTGVTLEDERNRSISISESDEARDDINGFGRNENQQISNFIRFIQRESRHSRDAEKALLLKGFLHQPEQAVIQTEMATKLTIQSKCICQMFNN